MPSNAFRNRALGREVFPLEVFSLIIHELADGEHAEFLPAMKACSLVCRAFVIFCQPHIFSTVTYGPYGKANKLRCQLYHSLVDRPLLATYVRNVIYEICASGGDDVDEEEDAELEASPTGTLVEILPKVTSLNIIHPVCHKNQPYESPCAASDCMELCEGIIDVFCLRTEGLVNLSISNVAGIEMWVILTTATLLSLELNNCETMWHDGAPEGAVEMQARSSQPSSLRKLVVRNSRNFACSMIKYCHQLEMVEMVDIISYFDEEDELDILKGSPRFVVFQYLHTLVLDDDEVDFWMEYCILSEKRIPVFPVLRDLTLRLDYNEHRLEVLDILNDNSEHIRNLERFALILNDVDETMEDDANEDDLASDLALKLTLFLQKHRFQLKHFKLRFGAKNPRYVNAYERGLPIITAPSNSLASIQGNNTIEFLEIQLDNIDDDLEMSVPELLPPSFTEWEKLDEVILGKGTADFPMLKRVLINVEFASDVKQEDALADVHDDHFFDSGDDLKNCWIFTPFLREPLARLYATSDLEFRCHINNEMDDWLIKVDYQSDQSISSTGSESEDDEDHFWAEELSDEDKLEFLRRLQTHMNIPTGTD